MRALPHSVILMRAQRAEDLLFPGRTEQQQPRRTRNKRRNLTDDSSARMLASRIVNAKCFYGVSVQLRAVPPCIPWLLLSPGEHRKQAPLLLTLGAASG